VISKNGSKKNSYLLQSIQRSLCFLTLPLQKDKNATIYHGSTTPDFVGNKNQRQRESTLSETSRGTLG